MTVKFLETSIAEWLNPSAKHEPAQIRAGWNEDELNALARGLGCEEKTFRANGETFTYFLSPSSLFARNGGMRSIFAFGSAGRALMHPEYGAERLLRELAPDLLA